MTIAWRHGFQQPGVPAALGAAVLFGAGTPLAKGLLAAVDPWLLAGLLYLGSGLGLGLYRRLRKMPATRLPAAEWPWLIGAIAAGGVAGPVLLMLGLSGMSASGASLPLNAEAVFTALLAWFVFRENVDRRIAFGMAAIVILFLGESAPASFWLAALLMGGGVWPHLSERHAHEHTHEPLEHEHAHTHDEHHQHGHDFEWVGAEPHHHPHQHAATTHTHRHFPDSHHRHGH
jgi:drug/metabolite transporter (DMT)-like permease